MGLKDIKDSSRYVVVFQYGSAVLFNIADHEAEQYLDTVRKHASGLLPEMRKDGILFNHTNQYSLDVFLKTFIFYDL